MKVEIPPFVRRILERLHGTGHEAYIAGGAVRDVVLRRSASDWDVATSASPEAIKSLFQDFRSFSLKHGTVTLVHKGRPFEVTSYRGSEYFGRHITEDLAHRDFTINAMAYDAVKETVLDPWGGRSDIQRKVLRAVGDPKDRFQEDPLRLLRAVRISVDLGFQIEKRTLKELSRMAGLISETAVERIREEVMKILLCPKPSPAFYLMVRTGLLKEILPELLEGYRKRQNELHRFTIFRHIMETVDLTKPEPVLRLTALLHDIAKPRVRQRERGRFRFIGHEKASAALAAEVMDRLKFGGGITEKVSRLISHHMDVINYNSRWRDGALRRLIRRVGPQDIGLLLEFCRADFLAHGLRNEPKLTLLDEIEERVGQIMKSPVALTRRDLAVDGREVMNMLGLAQGPRVGRVLYHLTEKVMDQPELNTREGLMGLLKEMKKMTNAGASRRA
jgi:tRNA nucleotidyltransferase (CCA-adding enzyme)